MEEKGGKEGWDFGREEEINGLETGGLTVFENRMIGFLREKRLPCCTTYVPSDTSPTRQIWQCFKENSWILCNESVQQTARYDLQDHMSFC